MSPLIETIRIADSVTWNVEYHQRRVDRSLGAEGLVSLDDYIHTLDLPTRGVHKLRIRYCEDGIIDHTIAEYVPRAIRTLRLIEDDYINYSFKFEQRQAIDRLYALRGQCDDIVIVRRGLVTDSSFANIALFDGQQWITPDEPLLMGTCRQRLIEQRILTPQVVTPSIMMHCQRLVLINAMLGFDESRAIEISSL